MSSNAADYHQVSSLSSAPEANCLSLFPETETHSSLRVYLWNAIVSGRGLIWRDDKLVTAPDLMPQYWKERLEDSGPYIHPSHAFTVPTRDIYEPCISTIGWGWQIYGHNIIEMIPRMLLAIRAAKELCVTPRTLIRSDTPSWVRNLLLNHLGFTPDRIEVFEPLKEKVRLHKGLFPTYPLFPGIGFHPATAQLLDDLGGLPMPGEQQRRVYLTRRQLPSDLHQWRSCENEEELGKIASKEFGFEELAPETLTWSEQVGLFRESAVICGLHGSALHTAIFADGELSVGVVGRRNNVQTHIANLRGHKICYVESESNQKGSFRVDTAAFRELLSMALSNVD